MPQENINLAPDNSFRQPKKINENPRQRPGKSRFKVWFFIFAALVIIGLLVFSSSAVFSDNNLVQGLSKFNLFKQLGRLVSLGDKNLQGEKEDRINMLIIGMGGRNHDGGTLADTIILVSYKPSTKQTAIMSIPRDLSVQTDNSGWIKINAIHAYAEQKEEKSGGRTMADALGKTLGEEIPYYAVVDFDGFERLIDEFGGVDVDVERDLVDYQYPVRGKEDVYPIESRYEILRLAKGQQHMDGELALKYTRSRHGLGVEGSDFARSRRQQKILAALKNKIFELNTIFNPKRISGLLSAYNDHINTNLEIWEMLKLAQFGKDIQTDQIINRSLDDGPEGLLFSRIMNGAYVLLPLGNNYDLIKQRWQNIFSNESQEEADRQASFLRNIALQEAAANASSTEETASSTPDITKDADAESSGSFKNEGAEIEIQNGTWTTGLAGQEKTRLEEKGFTVTATGNALNHEYAGTLIYDISKKNPLTAEELAKIYGSDVTVKIPADISSDADFLII
ncbi:MAG: LCP family protein, partial [Patescibacteria group bacterium]